MTHPSEGSLSDVLLLSFKDRPFLLGIMPAERGQGPARPGDGRRPRRARRPGEPHRLHREPGEEQRRREPLPEAEAALPPTLLLTL